MKIIETKTKSFQIRGLDDLDAIEVYVEDVKDGAGMITLVCFGQAWSNYWSSMGKGYDIAKFFISADDDYIANKLCEGGIRSEVTDWHAVSEKVGDEVCEQSQYAMIGAIEKAYGEEFAYIDFPTVRNHKYTYICKIIQAVRNAFKEMAEVEA